MEKRSVPLVNNVAIVTKCLDSLNKYIDHKVDLKIKYDNVFNEYENKGTIMEVPINEINHTNHPIFYLPHFPIVKEASSSTKVRPVYDGSAKSHNKISLNDALETGPALQGNIISILLRFRRWLIAI